MGLLSTMRRRLSSSGGREHPASNSGNSTTTPSHPEKNLTPTTTTRTQPSPRPLTSHPPPTTPPPPALDSPPARRRRIHRRRPSGASPARTTGDASSSPPFVRRRRPATTHGRDRAASYETPPEIAESVRYAWTCATYLVGVAGSLVPAPGRVGVEVLKLAREELRREWSVFEGDQVGWAGYLMEGSLADGSREPAGGGEEDGVGGRARLFVKEGREIVRAVEWARAAVEEACGSLETGDDE